LILRTPFESFHDLAIDAKQSLLSIPSWHAGLGGGCSFRDANHERVGRAVIRSSPARLARRDNTGGRQNETSALGERQISRRLELAAIVFRDRYFPRMFNELHANKPPKIVV